MKKFIIKIECNGNIDTEGMTTLLENMMDNEVDCTEMTIIVKEDK